jgi:succinate-semialdehyde dehydrogenase/glutarate-semialdehyde dehydrogenase
MCIHLERAYIHAAIYDTFTTKLVAAVKALSLGQTYDYSVDVGCLVSSAQVDAVERHVRDATEKGARVLAGGRRRPDVGPLAYEPTILEGVTAAMEVHAEETFGPVLALYRVDSDEEAIRLANDSKYGLSASIWSRDTRRAETLARRIVAGAVTVTAGAAAAAGSVEAPMGGMRDSGLGRRHGAEGIRKYTEAQTIAVQRLVPLAPPSWATTERYARFITDQLRILRTLRLR